MASDSTQHGRVPLDRYVWFLAIVLGGAAADLASKAWIIAELGMPGEQAVWWIIPDVLGFQTSLNEGALFGMGQGMTRAFALVSLVMAVILPVWLFLTRAARDRFLTVAIALVSAGILGNLYDRLGWHGLQWNYANAYHEVGEPVYAVRDWILVMIGPWPWPNFNLADSMLVCGVSFLFWQAFFPGKAHGQAQTSDPETATRDSGGSSPKKAT